MAKSVVQCFRFQISRWWARIGHTARTRGHQLLASRDWCSAHCTELSFFSGCSLLMQLQLPSSGEDESSNSVPVVQQFCSCNVRLWKWEVTTSQAALIPLYHHLYQIIFKLLYNIYIWRLPPINNYKGGGGNKSNFWRFAQICMPPLKHLYLQRHCSAESVNCFKGRDVVLESRTWTRVPFFGTWTCDLWTWTWHIRTWTWVFLLKWKHTDFQGIF